MPHPTWPHCPWCEKPHAETHACPPVRLLLARMKDRGDSLTMPTIEFADSPIEIPGFDEPGDTFLTQLVVQAAVVPVAGVTRAGLVFTGRDSTGKPLPRWLYLDTDQHIAAAAKLVDDMAGLAIRTATRQR